MRSTRRAVVAAAVLCLLAGSCGAAVPNKPPRALSTPTATPEPIPPCKPSFEKVAQIGGRKDRTSLSAASKQAAFYAAYFQGGRILSNGTVEQITFDAASDPAILSASAIADNKAWFLRREPWLFDGLESKAVPVPGGISVDSLSVGGGQVWVGGKEGEAPAILRREGDEWKRVPFSIPRFEHLSVTLDGDGIPYLLATQVVPKPPPPPGQVQTLELRTRTSVWKRNGDAWVEITPEKSFTSIVPGRDGVVYAIGPDIAVQRFTGIWTPIPFLKPESGRVIVTGAEVDTFGRLWLAGLHTTVEGATPDLWILAGEAIRRITVPPEAKADEDIGSLSVAPDGTVWLAAASQVFRGACG